MRFISSLTFLLLVVTGPHSLALASEPGSGSDSGATTSASVETPDSGSDANDSSGATQEPSSGEGATEGRETAEDTKEDGDETPGSSEDTTTEPQSQESSAPNNGVTITDDSDARVIEIACDDIVGDHTETFNDIESLTVSWSSSCDTPEATPASGMIISEDDERSAEVLPGTELVFTAPNGSLTVVFDDDKGREGAGNNGEPGNPSDPASSVSDNTAEESSDDVALEEPDTASTVSEGEANSEAQESGDDPANGITVINSGLQRELYINCEEIIGTHDYVVTTDEANTLSVTWHSSCEDRAVSPEGGLINDGAGGISWKLAAGHSVKFRVHEKAADSVTIDYANFTPDGNRSLLEEGPLDGFLFFSRSALTSQSSFPRGVTYDPGWLDAFGIRLFRVNCDNIETQPSSTAIDVPIAPDAGETAIRISFDWCLAGQQPAFPTVVQPAGDYLWVNSSLLELRAGASVSIRIDQRKSEINITFGAPAAPPPPPTPVSLEDARADIRYVYPDMPPAINGVSVGSPGQNFRDSWVDCRAITENATYNIPPTVSSMRLDLLNFLDCTVVTDPNVTPSIAGNAQRRIIATNGQAKITNTATGATLTVVYAAVPSGTPTLVSQAFRGVVGQDVGALSLTAVNFAPTGYSIDPALPDGLDLDPGTGEISGTPTAPSSGQYAITASDGTKQGTGILTLTVSATSAYVVTFDQEAGTNPYAVTVTPGESLSLPTTNSLKSNSVFAGWRTAPDGGGDLVGIDGATYTPSSSVTLHADWKPRVTITFQRNLTSDPHPVFPPELAPFVNTSNNLVLDFAQGSLITLPVPTRADNAFLGWTDATSCPGSGSQNVANWRGGAQVVAPSVANRTLRACWTTSQQFDFNANGGTFPADAGCQMTSGLCRLRWATGDPLGAGSGLPTIVLPEVTRAGHRFNGWYSAASGGTRIGGAGERVPLSVLTAQAQWTPLSLIGSAASITVTQAEAVTPWTVTAVAFTPNVFEISPQLPPGLQFNTATGEISGSPTQAQAATTYTVTATGPDGSATATVSIQVDALPVTVTFEMGFPGGSGPAPVTSAVDSSLTLPTPTRPGFTFNGWFDSATLDNLVGLGGDTYTLTADTTLYAGWSAIAVSPGPPTGAQPGPPSRPTPPRGRPTEIIVPIIPVTPRPVVAAPVFPREPVPPVTPAPPAQQTPVPTPAPTAPAPVLPPRTADTGSVLQRNLEQPSGTVDFGSGVQSSGGATQGAPGATRPTIDVPVRTPGEKRAEVLQGFAPGSTTEIEVVGSRTGARFVLSAQAVSDKEQVAQAMASASTSSSTDFFEVRSVQAVSAPEPAPSWDDAERNVVSSLFESSGLPAPKSLNDFDVSGFTEWVKIESEAKTYVPGSTVYLTVTSEPIVIGQAKVNASGDAELVGTIPAELLGAGEHRIRLIGIRLLDGVNVDEDGNVQVSDATMAEIQRFDQGTQVTVAVLGQNPEGEQHTSLRIVALPEDVSVAWWPLWLIVGAFGAFVAARTRGLLGQPIRRSVGLGVVGVSALPAIVIGVVSGVLALTWWGLAAGLLALGLAFFVPHRDQEAETA